jgi:hypothetical protein
VILIVIILSVFLGNPATRWVRMRSSTNDGSPNHVAAFGTPILGMPRPDTTDSSSDSADVRTAVPAEIPGQDVSQIDAPRHYIVYISVVDRATRQPVPHAHVELHFAGADLSSDTVDDTGPDGRLVAEFPGGLLRASAWSGNGVADRTVEERLEGSKEHRIEIVLEDSIEVTGRVRDSLTGRPIEGVRISAPSLTQDDTAHTDNLGEYHFLRFPAVGREHTLLFDKPGYAKALRVLTVEPGGAWTLLAIPGSESEHRGTMPPAVVDVRLLPELQITGHIEGDIGEPVANARISVEGYFHLTPLVASPDLGQAESDVQGHFTVVGLRTDVSHSVLIHASGWSDVLCELAAPGSSIQTMETVRLTRGLALDGVVSDFSGRPAESIEVLITFLDRDLVESSKPTPEIDAAGGYVTPDAGQRQQGRYLRTRTNERGVFRFESLAAGHCLLQARGESPSSVAELPIELMTGKSQSGIAMTLPSSCLTLSGIIKHDGTPLSGVRVMVRRNGWVAEVGTRQDGSFLIAGLADTGPYDLAVHYVDQVTSSEWNLHRQVWANGLQDLELQRIVDPR